jgi:hypothetical protein
MHRKNILFFSCAVLLLLTSCIKRSPLGTAPFVYMRENREYGYEFIEYYPTEEVAEYINTKVNGVHYRNAYYDGQKFYVSLSHALFVYDGVSKKITEFSDTVSNAIKKINGEIWLAIDNGFGEQGYSSSLCKMNDQLEINCLYEIKNQQINDFYIDFENEVFYGAGAGVKKEPGDTDQQHKIVQYNMQTGEEKSVRTNGKHILADRLTHICPGQFITSDGDIYRETGEKIGEVIGRDGKQVNSQINDVTDNTTIFLGNDDKSLEVYGCKDNKTTRIKTIELEYMPNIYPTSHSWETSDDGEISMPIRSDDDIFEFIGFQSVNVRTGEVQVHLFDEPVYRLHAVARFA